MSSFKPKAAAPAVVLAAGGCVSQPSGPTIAVMPSPNKPFDVFQQDQALCKQYADQQVLTGAVGTALGAGLGAAIGGGRGAGIGATEGALGGTLFGLGPAQRAQMSLQQRYNLGYAQCMYARGDQVPGFVPAYAPPPPPPPPRG